MWSLGLKHRTLASRWICFYVMWFCGLFVFSLHAKCLVFSNVSLLIGNVIFFLGSVLVFLVQDLHGSFLFGSF